MLARRLEAFMAEHVYPNERRYYLEAERLGPWSLYPVVEALKPLAREAGLWNLFLPAAEVEGGLSNDYVVNGRKWYTTNATHPRCELVIFMGVVQPAPADPCRRQSMVLVPRATLAVRVIRSLPVLGFYGVPDRASEMVFEDVRVPKSAILLGEGRGFEIAQGRLGPGRIHHCMRLIGLCERVLERMCRRAELRQPFGRPLAEQTVTLERIAEARALIEQARLLTQKAAWMMDTVGAKAARQEIALIKIVAPSMAQQVVDWAMQTFGGGGTGNDHVLAAAFSTARLLRLADGPDEVHRNQVARLEIRRHSQTSPDRTGGSAETLTLQEAERMADEGLWPQPEGFPA